MFIHFSQEIRGDHDVIEDPGQLINEHNNEAGRHARI
jgi:hypothetical protein